MDYPREFSPEARARVEAERLRATREYEKRRAAIPSTRYKSYREDEENLRHFIMRVFLAFAKEACKLGSEGTWTVDEVRSEADDFLRRFTIEAYYGYGQDASGRKLPEMTSNWGGGLLFKVQHEFQKSPEWHQYEDELLAVAETIGRRSAARTKRTGENTATKRRASINSFLLKMKDAGHAISRKDIWTAAGYKDRTEFQRFQRDSSDTTRTAIENFNRILQMTPDDFLRVLKNKTGL